MHPRPGISWVFDAIDARWFDLNLPETGANQLIAIFTFSQQDALTDLRQDFALRHQVRHGKPSRWFQHPEGFAQDAIVGRGQWMTHLEMITFVLL
jgi:hypothetical protein